MHVPVVGPASAEVEKQWRKQAGSCENLAMESEPDEQREALTALRHAIALWYFRQGSAADIVLAACDLLVIGVDSPTLMELAAVQLSCAEVEVDPLLEATLLELGQPELAPETVAAERTALDAMAHRALSGAISPRYLTSWV